MLILKNNTCKDLGQELAGSLGKIVGKFATAGRTRPKILKVSKIATQRMTLSGRGGCNNLLH